MTLERKWPGNKCRGSKCLWYTIHEFVIVVVSVVEVVSIVVASVVEIVSIVVIVVVVCIDVVVSDVEVVCFV